MKATIYTPPSVEPVTVFEMKTHLRITHFDDDVYIKALIKAAREWAEGFTRRSFVQQTWDEYFDCFPSGDYFELAKAPLLSVTGVYYTDYAGVITTMTVTTQYVVDTDSIPGRIVLPYNTTWPSFTPSTKNPIKVRYISGYDDDGGSPVVNYTANVPEGIKSAIKLMVGHYYNNREQTVAGVGIQEIPFGAEWLLWPYRIMTL